MRPSCCHCMRRVGLTLGFALLLAAGAVESSRVRGAGRDEDLSVRQRDVQAILQDVTRRMERLAQTLQETQPEDAKRLREAAEAVRTFGLERLLGEISSLLSESNFVEAVGRQDSAVQELDKIISLLEEARFRDVSPDKALEARRAALQELSRITSRQKTLLRKTREFLDAKQLGKLLEELSGEASRLAGRQADLNQGKDSAGGERRRDAADEEALRAALEKVENLSKQQDGVSARLARLKDLPSSRSAADEARRLEDLLKEVNELEKAAAEATDGKALEELQRSAQDAASRLGEAAKRQEGSRTEKGAGTEPRSEPPDRKPTGSGAGKRSAQEAAAARKALEDAAGKLQEASRDGSDPAAVRERIRRAVEAARRGLEAARRRAARHAQESEDARTRKLSPLSQDQGLLEKETSGAARGMQESSTKAASEAARSALEEAARSLQEAAGAMRRAAEGLSRLKTGRASGQPEGKSGGSPAAEESAKEATEAQKKLAGARKAIQEGRKALAARTARQKAADRQTDIARKTAGLRKEVERLQKKLGGKKAGLQGDLQGASKDLSEAGRSMQQAAESRRSGDRAAARSQGSAAQQKLSLARKKLEKAGAATPKPPPVDRGAEEQEKLARLTRHTARKLSETAQGDPSRSSGVNSAADSMDKAGQDLKKQDAKSAEENQKDAISKLQQTQQQLQRETEELARLNRERTMTSMSRELTEIRQGQEEILAETLKLHATQGRQASRSQKLRLRRMTRRLFDTQSALAERVGTLNKKLEEQLSRVFLFVLKSINADMLQVCDQLGESDVGVYTQFLQKEIIRDLDQLLGVMKDELSRIKEQKKSASKPVPPSAQKLVPAVAELRMLKEMQVDVNRRTRNLEDIRKASSGKVAKAWDRSLTRLLQKQGSVSRLTGKLLEDFRKLQEDLKRATSGEGAGEAEEAKPGEKEMKAP